MQRGEKGRWNGAGKPADSTFFQFPAHTLSSVIHLFCSLFMIDHLWRTSNPIHKNPSRPSQTCIMLLCNMLLSRSTTIRPVTVCSNVARSESDQAPNILPHFSPKRASACSVWKPRLRSIWVCYRLSEMALARQLCSGNRTILLADNRKRLMFSSFR